MQLKKIFNGKALYQTPTHIWVAKGMTFYAIDYNGKRLTPKISLGSPLEKLIGYFRLSRHALRVGIHHMLPLPDGNLFVVVKRKAMVIAPDGNIISTFTGFQGNKPGHQGVCLAPNGSIFFGEYLLNTDRSKEINLYRSDDCGRSFNVIKSFAPGEIRHIHFIKWDPFEKCLWMGTGDYGENNQENCLYRSSDNGESWELIGQGSQDWRAIGICFTPTHLVWGTDAGSCPDAVHLIRMDRASKKLEILADLEGPCHGCAQYADGRIFFSTGVEGGENEKDNYARLKEYHGENADNIFSLKKDIWPLIIQYGVMRFPLGTERCNKIAFTPMGLNGHGETIMIEK